ncbi:MAG: DUF898 domain-containing protein [Alphaproteobacteria bacterium]|nr:DUF898 domain-containing protein [Alphaproteobacteria bacterium]
MTMPQAPLAATEPQPGRALRLTFTGRGGEYFRIWIVNLALTILTLGIYSAWAKVRRLQYFYRHTSLAGSSFEYHANPIAILKGRLIAVALLVGYNFTGYLELPLGLALLGVLLLVLPWMIQRSLAFQLHNSSWRGLRFRFAGTLRGAYLAWMPALVIGMAFAGTGLVFAWLGRQGPDVAMDTIDNFGPRTVGATILLLIALLVLALPFAHRQIKNYQHASSRLGAAAFRFRAGVRSFYWVYAKGFGLLFWIVVLAIAPLIIPIQEVDSLDPEIRRAAIEQMLSLVMPIVFYAGPVFIVLPYFAARLRNLVWNGTSIEDHTFVSSLRAFGLGWLYLTNFVLMLLTVGLFKPFADIRLARYRLTHTELLARGSLDDFVAIQEREVGAAGTEVAGAFDFDISF